MYIGVDIGGSKILVVAGTASTITAQRRFETPADGEQAVSEIIHHIEQLVGSNSLAAIGVAAPGPLDRKHGVIFPTPARNLDWAPTPIVQKLKNHFKVPVAFEKDADVAALAEATVGAAASQPHVLYVTISTGVGTGVVLDGQIYHGAHDPEGGEITIPSADGPQQLEELVSGRAFKRRFGKYGYEVTDPAIWDEYAKDLATGLRDLSVVLSPDIVVIGGGMGVHFDLFKEPLQRHLSGQPDNYPFPPIVPAQHMETAVGYGALILAERAAHRA